MCFPESPFLVILTKFKIALMRGEGISRKDDYLTNIYLITNPVKYQKIFI